MFLLGEQNMQNKDGTTLYFSKKRVIPSLFYINCKKIV